MSLLGSISGTSLGSVGGSAGSVTGSESGTITQPVSTIETPVAHTAGGPDASFTNASVDGSLPGPPLVSDSGVVSGPPAGQSPAAIPVDVLSFSDTSHASPLVSVLGGPSSLGNLADADVASGSYGESAPIDANAGPDWNHAPLVSASVLQDSGTSVTLGTQDLTDGLMGTSGSSLLGELGNELNLTHTIGHGVI